jgi:preprotein translocase subunit SecB
MTVWVFSILATVYFFSCPSALQHWALEKISMKKALLFAIVLATASIPAIAAKKDQSINIPMDVQVGSTLVHAGDYTLSITGTGPDVQVTINRGSKAVASFSATEVQSKGLTGISALPSGKVPTLAGIQLHDVNLVLQSAPHSGQ